MTNGPKRNALGKVCSLTLTVRIAEFIAEPDFPTQLLSRLSLRLIPPPSRGAPLPKKEAKKTHGYHSNLLP